MTTTTTASTAPPPGESAQIRSVPIDRLQFHPRNIRRDLGDLRELTSSIRAHGVLVPLIAERRGGGYLRLLAGHRRLAAAQLAGRARVPVLIVEEHEDDRAIEVMLAENCHRAGLTAADKHQAVRVLVEDFGHHPTRIAHCLGVHPTTISAWLRTHSPDRDGPPQNRPTRRGRHPRIPPTAIHHLYHRWSGHAPEALLDERRQLLGGWEPGAPATPQPLTAEATAPVELDPPAATATADPVATLAAAHARPLGSHDEPSRATRGSSEVDRAWHDYDATRAEALRLLDEDGLTQDEVAAQLGVSPGLVRRWDEHLEDLPVQV